MGVAAKTPDNLHPGASQSQDEIQTAGCGTDVYRVLNIFPHHVGIPQEKVSSLQIFYESFSHLNSTTPPRYRAASKVLLQQEEKGSMTSAGQ